MNMQQIMAQAQKMQKDIMAKKNEIDSLDFVGKSNWIEITFKGSKEVSKVNIINDEALKIENKEILCDMIFLAIKDAMEQIDNKTEEKLGSYSKMNGLF
ncbi:MAG: YbaB/EbfC family nucleoid-associated protein [bacterium]|nr:YbaB/EbfC family nucleoid-associated protein [bacterium]